MNPMPVMMMMMMVVVMMMMMMLKDLKVFDVVEKMLQMMYMMQRR
jgi:hypothetical protein